MTEKWDEIHRKYDLVRVSGEFELSEFELLTEVLLYFILLNKCTTVKGLNTGVISNVG